MDATVRDRFMQKVDFQYNGCWLWKGSKDSFGYGHFRYEGKIWLSHRFSFKLHINEPNDDKEIHHLCGNKSCVNPEHLQEVFHDEHTGENQNTNRTHCARGHEFTVANTIERPNGWRACRICHNAKALESYHRRKGSICDGETL